MKDHDVISISAIGSISSLGIHSEHTVKQYLEAGHCFEKLDHSDSTFLAAPLNKNSKNQIQKLRGENALYKHLDDSVLYAIYATQHALKQCNWDHTDSFGINIGSSRGATQLFEKHHSTFLRTQRSNSNSSPTTTLGNISSWVAQHVLSNGPVISHSITCSTALHALLNGMAWIKSGMATKFIAGGSEAALTPFTFAQMQALRIYSKYENEYPCRPLDFDKKSNTMILGEGAAVACIERGCNAGSLAIIEGIGYANEALKHNVSISTNGACFQKSMKMAIGKTALKDIDIIILHAPGTVKGDLAELNAINAVFDHKTPSITSNKWKIGHTFASSGMLSIEMAIFMLKYQQFVKIPYLTNQKTPEKISKVLINAVGFGGNAVSILLRAV